MIQGAITGDAAFPPTSLAHILAAASIHYPAATQQPVPNEHTHSQAAFQEARYEKPLL